MTRWANYHPLDEVIWRSLTSVQGPVAQGNGQARRYPPQVAPFAATIDFTPRSYQSLLGLMDRGDDQIALFTPEEIVPPAPFSVLRRAPVDQMVLLGTQAWPSPIASGIELLGKLDIPAMIALAEATKPGPFGPRTIELGRYIGVRREERLVAMAGERMRLTGFTELSAVCVDPAYRGHGLAASMIRALVAPILDRSETPFLHVFTSNRPAITLYQRLGFVLRRQVHLAVLGVDRAKEAHEAVLPRG